MRASWDHWYKLQRWRNRAEQQKAEQPLCEMCLAKGLIVAATTADHIIPHKGDYVKFWFGKLQSLCTNCHNRGKKQIEIRGYTNDIGVDGWPTDAKHPVNKLGKKL
jgi:5-methylcytosine-specific restriction enzyme A